MKNNKVHIAIIDDGVNETFYEEIILEKNIEINSELKVIERIQYDKYAYSHGSTCAAIIKKYAPNSTISSIKILNEATKLGNKAQLIKAIDYCIDNNIRLINLSLGTINFRDFDLIKKTVMKAYKHGVIIVAACNNMNVFTYPASLSMVLGVRCYYDINIQPHKYYYMPYSFDGIEIVANGVHSLKTISGEVRESSCCNSFAAPLITAEVAKIIEENKDLELFNIKRELYKRSINFDIKQELIPFYPRIDWIEKAIIFSSKNFINNFPSTAIIEEFIIKNFTLEEGINEVIEILSGQLDRITEVDTIIINMDYFKIENCKNALNDLISFIEHHGKNLILFDDSIIEKWVVPSKRFTLWSSSLYKSNYTSILKKNRTITIPVIFIHDYNDSMHLSFVLELQKLFKNDGYCAIAADSLAYSILYNVEYVPKEDLNLLNLIEDTYNADILIYGTDDNYSTEIIADVKIVLNTQKNECIISFNEDDFSVTDIIASLNINKIYETIIKKFSL
ncbi:Subtilase family protein [Clostridium cavendishii DSM 21758]|uniref:Subtilase family protein n=1 Tax=Clostridium cavendishii DSM 21758 TaxID=1121302 RepID=A0A1M6R3I0_9CLOT|nr:S8 family serine peptidase [Clostridium cavendishii]SHK27014.1 Subtilase family protein [Clostridium cavendishii DSM 21758]